MNAHDKIIWWQKTESATLRIPPYCRHHHNYHPVQNTSWNSGASTFRSMTDRIYDGGPVSIITLKVKWCRYRPGVAQRVGRGIALLFHDRGTRRGWVVSSTPRPHFTPGKDPVSIVQEAGWAPGPVWMGGKSRPHRHSIPDHPVRRQSLYRLSYRSHIINIIIPLRYNCL